MSKMIVSNPKIMMGKPVVRGTRITVELVLEKLAAGESIEEILDAHPRLSRNAIQACLSFAAAALNRITQTNIQPPIGSPAGCFLFYKSLDIRFLYVESTL